MNNRDTASEPISSGSVESSLFLARVIDLKNGKHGPYAVTILPSGRKEFSVTFSLGSDVWKEGRTPEKGATVILGGVFLKKRGWRASYARHCRFSDDDLVFLNSKEFKEWTAQSMKATEATEQTAGSEKGESSGD